MTRLTDLSIRALRRELRMAARVAGKDSQSARTIRRVLEKKLAERSLPSADKVISGDGKGESDA